MRTANIRHILDKRCCKLANVQISDTAGEPKFDGEEIVGITTAASCSGGEHNLVLEHLKEITDEVALRTTESTVSNWRETETVTVKGSVKFLGTGGSVSAQVSSSFGGTVTWESSRKQITESATTVESRVKISYKTPGAAMIVGFEHSLFHLCHFLLGKCETFYILAYL